MSQSVKQSVDGRMQQFIRKRQDIIRNSKDHSSNVQTQTSFLVHPRQFSIHLWKPSKKTSNIQLPLTMYK